MERLKLTEKQIVLLTDISNQRNHLNDKEKIILEIIFDNANVDLSKCYNLNIQDGFLTYNIIEQPKEEKNES